MDATSEGSVCVCVERVWGRARVARVRSIGIKEAKRSKGRTILYEAHNNETFKPSTKTLWRDRSLFTL